MLTTGMAYRNRMNDTHVTHNSVVEQDGHVSVSYYCVMLHKHPTTQGL